MNRIAELRKSRDLSQSALATALGIAQNTLSQYENETRRPTARVITNIAKIFDVTENYVLGFPDPKANIIKETQTPALLEVTKIERFDSVDRVNFYLNIGWRLLHVGLDAEHYDDGSGHSRILYTLGWFGDPANTLPCEPPADGDEKYDADGWYYGP